MLWWRMGVACSGEGVECMEELSAPSDCGGEASSLGSVCGHGVAHLFIPLYVSNHTANPPNSLQY